MWTFKNLLAVALFLFGSMFLWMTAAVAGRTPPPPQAFDGRAKVKTLVADEGASCRGGQFIGAHTGEFLGMASTG